MNKLKGENNMVNKTEERKYLRKKNEEINEKRKDISQTGSHGTISKTPSSWWEERKSIGQPSPQDQEKRYRGEQVRYKQEREDNMVKKIEETGKINEESKDISETGAHRTISTTSSSWWEERKSIGQPSPQDQEKLYRGEQVRYKQEKEDNMVKKIEETEKINEESKDISETGVRGTISTTSSSWWEERKEIGQPSPEDQEKRYRGEQEKYGQERQKAEYLRSIQETARPEQEYKERYESEKQTRIEGEEKKDFSQIMSETYKEFYSEWVKTLRNSFGKMYKIPTLESNKETFEKLLVSAEETNKIYNLWIAELEENSRATRELLQGEPDPAKYTEAYDMWIKSYGRMLNMLNTVPLRQNMKEIFENITGTPDIYSEAFEQISKIWIDSYEKLYVPYIDSMLKVSVKSEEFSRGKASPEAYMEFYTLWMNTYQEKNKEFYNLWAKMYGNAFDNFLDNTPTLRPFKEVMEPVKNAAKLYTDMFTSISNIWVKSYNTSKEAV